MISCILAAEAGKDLVLRSTAISVAERACGIDRNVISFA
jgi:hypothetical protein